jgi:hypothetical protein
VAGSRKLAGGINQKAPVIRPEVWDFINKAMAVAKARA